MISQFRWLIPVREIAGIDEVHSRIPRCFVIFRQQSSLNNYSCVKSSVKAREEHAIAFRLSDQNALFLFFGRDETDSRRLYPPPTANLLYSDGSLCCGSYQFRLLSPLSNIKFEIETAYFAHTGQTTFFNIFIHENLYASTTIPNIRMYLIHSSQYKKCS